MEENKLENLIWILFAILGAMFVVIGLATFVIVSNLICLIFPGFGMIFLIIGVTKILEKVKKSKDEKSLIENGELIYASYVETVLNTLYIINGQNPYNIICEWENPLDNKKYVFKSKNIWINPESIIEKRNIKYFPVYIDKDNMAKYVIDIDVLTEDQSIM